MVATPLDVESQLGALLGDSSTEFDVSRRTRIYCNRNLRMDQIELIGFDMDYTLALYHQDKLERLSIDLTLAKMVTNHGYPAEIRTLSYDPHWAIRGLMVDRELGNVFKMDRHSYVGRCYHGFRKLSSDERKAIYRNEKINLSSDRYDWIDTLFGLPEAVMYVTLVDWFDRTRGPGAIAYDKLFADIRMSIDEAHRDDTLKSVIKADLAGYIVKDPELAETLHKLRSSGKKLFLLTNSLWDYTDAVMRFLLDGQRQAYASWRNYFDVVVVGGAKPAFFNERRPFVQLDPTTGATLDAEVKQLLRDRVYMAGNVAQFEEMTHIRGEHVLYIGDHIYGDILRLRKQHMWRTAMVLQELDREIAVLQRLENNIRDLDLLDRRRRNLESEIDYQGLRLKKIQRLLEDAATAAPLRPRLDDEKKLTKLALDSLRDRHQLMTEEVTSLESTLDRAYNPHWGSCLREDNENSRFGEQVNDYADLYTSRVANFLSYSPLRYFRAPRRPMPHEV
ncbi:MAG: HAD-IG family 5'-nucleotidase [Deltaproteobacteria bacterium]|nr:HAD-IG family 5'-nucleotidase [Deltaproteobacteria bacterium]